MLFVIGDNDGDGFPDDGDTCVTRLTNQLKRDGFVTHKEKADIQKCAGKARIP